MLKVGIDARFATRQPRRGIGNYSLNLLHHLVAEAPNVSFILYIASRDSENILPIARNVKVRLIRIPLYPVWEQLILPVVAAIDRVNILHSLGNTGPLFKLGNYKSVISLMDVIFMQSGEGAIKPLSIYQSVGRLYRKFIAPKCSRVFDAVITISHYSKLDIIAKIPEVNKHNIHVVHLGYDSISSKINSSTIASVNNEKKPFILVLGASDPRKNTTRLVRAFLSLLREKHIQEDLVICGYEDWESSESYDLTVKANAISRVKFFKHVSEAQLLSLYKQARIFVYPSLFEGFGLPILEAFALSCPVVASNTTSIPEVAGDAVLYIDPYNTDEIAKGIFTLLSDSYLRNTLTISGRARVRMFTWQECAMKTLKIYRALTPSCSHLGGTE